MKSVANTSGGSAAAAGFNFHAILGAIAGIHALRGKPVHWTDGLTAAHPCAVSFETAGPGDDMSLELVDGSTVELQVKKGLRADRQRFWPALDSLCEGIDADRCNYGILIVCPHSSIPVRQRYALALRRIGDGRNDGASTEQTRLYNHIEERGYDPAKVCSRIRIKTVSALEDDGDAIAAARFELGHICADHRQVILAWHTLCRDALSAIVNKGRRTVRSLSAHLCASNIYLEDTAKDSPAALSQCLLRWTMSRTEHFQVLGISRPLLTDLAWLPLSASVRDSSIEPASAAEQSLADYHAIGEKSRTGQDLINARTIGTFRKQCVVIGGPGSGKSLLLKLLAREFAKDSYVSIRVSLRDLARRMQEKGCAVEEGLFQLGLDGTGISPEQFRAASLGDLVLLCDGLDECGHHQHSIASGLQNILASHPSYRIVVTTRPIGYTTTELHGWRHYQLEPLAREDTAKHLATICGSVLQNTSRDADELLPQIRSYLKEDSVTGILSRSPLLLAFGAALFLNDKDPCRTKSELYKRIFRLIDEAQVPRKDGTEPPEKAIRNSVLNQLGWLVIASPLLPSDELEKQCARTMQQAIGGTYLQAFATVQASITYWEEAGLIERLRHPETDLIAFIHKTCGEFAAALYLSEMEPDEARETIMAALSNPDWNEVLDFATQTPLATILAEILVAEFDAAQPDLSKLKRLFRVLVRPETSLSPAERRSFLERVFTLARSEDRQKAYRVGRCLTEYNLSRMQEVEEMALDIASVTTEWSRLVGWGVLACHFPSSLHQNDLEDILYHFMKRSRDKDFFVLQESKLPFGPHPDRSVFENFMIGALKCLLTSQDTEYQNRLIADVRQSQSNATVSFFYRFKALLKQLDREDVLRTEFGLAGISASLAQSVPEEFYTGMTSLLTDVVPSAFLHETVGPAPLTGLKYNAALFKMAGILNTTVSDAYVWSSGETHLSNVHALLRAAAYVFDLPAERLASEAKKMLATIETLIREGERQSCMSVLPDVDVAEIDWNRAQDIDLETDMLEGLVHHSSEWVQHLAAVLLDTRLHGTERLNVCMRMLATGTGNTLYFASALAAASPGGEELILHRLGRHSVEGLHHLFDQLKVNGWQVMPYHLPILKNCLVNSNAKTAVSAARCCQTTASSADNWLVPLLQSAMSYWLEHEEPNPKGVGSVPDSPREALLRTLCDIAPPAFDELAKLAGDSRTDVSNAAVDGIISLAIESSDNRSRLVASILAKQFVPRQCEKLLGDNVPYTAEELSILCGLRSDPEPSFRVLAVIRVFVHPAMDSEEALAAAASMKDDEDGNVRDAVHKFLDDKRKR